MIRASRVDGDRAAPDRGSCKAMGAMTDAPNAMQLELEFQVTTDGKATVRVRGELDIATADQAYAYLRDVVDSQEDVRANDPGRSELYTVLMQWKEKLGLKGAHTIRQVVARAIPDPDFFNALMTVAAANQGGGISNDRLGRYLARNSGKIVGRLKLTKVGNVHGYLLWSVINV